MAVPTIMRIIMEIVFLVEDSTKIDIFCANSDFSMHCAHFMMLAKIRTNDTVGAR